jgi:hypothetical protein
MSGFLRQRNLPEPTGKANVVTRCVSLRAV